MLKQIAAFNWYPSGQIIVSIHKSPKQTAIFWDEYPIHEKNHSLQGPQFLDIERGPITFPMHLFRRDPHSVQTQPAKADGPTDDPVRAIMDHRVGGCRWKWWDYPAW